MRLLSSTFFNVSHRSIATPQLNIGEHALGCRCAQAFVINDGLELFYRLFRLIFGLVRQPTNVSRRNSGHTAEIEWL